MQELRTPRAWMSLGLYWPGAAQTQGCTSRRLGAPWLASEWSPFLQVCTAPALLQALANASPMTEDVCCVVSVLRKYSSFAQESTGQQQ